jgi:hypothetical protein
MNTNHNTPVSRRRRFAASTVLLATGAVAVGALSAAPASPDQETSWHAAMQYCKNAGARTARS